MIGGRHGYGSTNDDGLHPYDLYQRDTSMGMIMVLHNYMNRRGMVSSSYGEG